MFNSELAHKVLDHIAAHPEDWEQTSWRCSTGMCFAGWAVELSDETEWGSNDPREFLFRFVTIKGRPTHEHAADAAAKVLGLHNVFQADLLFNASNDYEDLVRLVERLEQNPTDTMGYESANEPHNLITDTSNHF